MHQQKNPTRKEALKQFPDWIQFYFEKAPFLEIENADDGYEIEKQVQAYPISFLKVDDDYMFGIWLTVQHLGDEKKYDNQTGVPNLHVSTKPFSLFALITKPKNLTLRLQTFASVNVAS